MMSVRIYDTIEATKDKKLGWDILPAVALMRRVRKRIILPSVLAVMIVAVGVRAYLLWEARHPTST